MLEKKLLDKKDAPRSKLLIYQFIADFQKSGGSNRKSVSKNIEFTHVFVHKIHIYIYIYNIYCDLHFRIGVSGHRQEL